jgi:hypothetical protein
LNNHDVTAEEAGAEFFYAVGRLLEGKELDQLEFTLIDRARVLQIAKEG